MRARSHFAFGSPRDPAALREAGVYRAHTVVVLCNPSRAEGDGLLPEDDLMIDADAMTTLRYIVELTESRAVPPKVVVELIRGSNIKFVNYQRSHYHADSAAYIDVDESDEDEDDFGALRHGTGELDLVLRPAFASGACAPPRPSRAYPWCASRMGVSWLSAEVAACGPPPPLVTQAKCARHT